MFERILVPLDGSERAERALPVAARIARATGGSLIVVQVVHPVNEYEMSPVQPIIVTQEMVDAMTRQAREYLTHIIESDELEGIGVQTKVLAGAVAFTLCSFAQEIAADLIVMCSHGYTGLKRWLLGSVADIVARSAPVPLLIIREGGPVFTNMFQDGRIPRVLVTIDGSLLSEAVLEPAAHLAAALAAPQRGALHLLRVVDFPDFYGHGKSQTHISIKMIEQAKWASEEYLTSLMEQLQKGRLVKLNLSITASVVSGTDVADAIIQASESPEEGYAMLAMSTHGRSGWERWVIGSITERVLHGTKLPLLIIRPERIAKAKEAVRDQARAVTIATNEGQGWVGLL